MKKLLLMLSLSTALSMNISNAGVPVIDPGVVATLNQQIETWKKEAERYKESFDLNTQHFAALTGVRDIKAFLNEAQGILGQVEDLGKWLEKQDQIFKHGKNILAPELRKIFDSFELTNICEYMDLEQKNKCEGGIIVDVIKQESNKNNLKQLEERIATINKISQKMMVSDDPKESMDLNNAMSTQLSLLQADKVKMDIQKSIEESQQRLLEKQELDRLEAINNNHKFW